MAEKSDRLDILIALTRVLAEERTLESALRAVTDAALELLPATHASLRLFDDTRTRLLSHARSGAGQHKSPAEFRAGEGVLGTVADTGKPALVLDTEQDPRFLSVATGFPLRSLVAVPMVAGGRVVGVLSASSPDVGAFSENHRDLTQLLANCTAPAIETARLAHLAVTDDLTRAYNQRYLGPRLAEEVGRARRGEPFSLLMLDLDHFKRVNDQHGHAIGDEVLKGFVERTESAVRDTDVLIRRGGEEFLLLMPATPPEEALTVAERIRQRVADEPIETESASIPLKVSIGVATWEPDETGSEVEARADAALYRAKAEGRDRVVQDRP